MEINKTIPVLKPYFEQEQIMLRDFLEALHSRSLRYCASDLMQTTHLSAASIEPALHRAIRACSSLGIAPHDHFKKFYRMQKEGVSTDWKLSNMGLKLTILNIDPVNPLIARLQIYLLEKMQVQ